MSGDIPAIVMIVVSIVFFLSSIYTANVQFQSKKPAIDMQAALVDAASTFLKESARIRPEEIEETSEYLADKLMKIRQSYSVNIYVELKCAKEGPPPCDRIISCHSSVCRQPPENAEVLSKRFPIAIQGNTELDVHPGLITVSIYR